MGLNGVLIVGPVLLSLPSKRNTKERAGLFSLKNTIKIILSSSRLICLCKQEAQHTVTSS